MGALLSGKISQSFVCSLKQEKHETASLSQVQGWVKLAAGPMALQSGSVPCHDLQRCGVCLIKLHADPCCKLLNLSKLILS